MREEISAGMVVFYQDALGNREYLLLQYGVGYWDLPKGKLEPGETELDAAIREVKEETNLDLRPYGDFRQAITYFFKDRQGQMVHKTVTYFCGQAPERDTVRISDEHLSYRWVPFYEAQKVVSYTNAKQLLQLADYYITQQTSQQDA